MGTILLIVVMAAWAAVLLPPLLRSRAENRPNSSVSDFRAQLSSLQRAVPSRGITVRTMGRSLAPSSLSRPAAAGRPGVRGSVRSAPSPRGQNSFGPPRPTRGDVQRMGEVSLRTRSHGLRDPSEPVRRPLTEAGNATSVVKRRRANVLFVLVLTTLCAGFLAATTDNQSMVYVFALGMIALGGYLYLLVTLNQREQGRPVAEPSRRAPRRAPMPEAHTAPAPRDPLLRNWRSADGLDVERDVPAHDSRVEHRSGGGRRYDDGSGHRRVAQIEAYEPYEAYEAYQGYEAHQLRRDEVRSYELPHEVRAVDRRRTAPARTRTRTVDASSSDDRVGPAATGSAAVAAAVPGSGQSGRISYGRAAGAWVQQARDGYAVPVPRDPRDPFGREQQGRDITRGTPLRNGRHATGQHPVQGRQDPERRRLYSQAG
jgi:hypothetical protein